jgi:hypothetical protein
MGPLPPTSTAVSGGAQYVYGLASDRSLCATGSPTAKKFGEARDLGGILATLAESERRRPRYPASLAAKATENQRLFRSRQETGFARDCVVVDAFHCNRSPT